MGSLSALAENSKIKEFVLSEDEVFRIEGGIGVTTTVVFPAPIGVVGGDLVADTATERGTFTIANGPNHFSVGALVPEGITNVTVFCQGKAYSLELVVSNNPIYKARFVDAGDANEVETQKQRAFDEQNGKFLDLGDKKPFSVSRIVGFLDKCRALPALATQVPNPVANILFEAKEKVYKVEGFQVELREAYRDNALDAVGFKLVFKSLDGKQHLYDPEGFGISAGEKYYAQITSVADGVIPALGASEVFFAIAGDGNGGRNELSLLTDFTLHMQRLDPKASYEKDRTGDGTTLFYSPPNVGILDDDGMRFLPILPPLPLEDSLPVIPEK